MNLYQQLVPWVALDISLSSFVADTEIVRFSHSRDSATRQLMGWRLQLVARLTQ